ncbi:hypothetical protein GCM10027098_21370 [Bowmanella dokdonensis]
MVSKTAEIGQDPELPGLHNGDGFNYRDTTYEINRITTQSFTDARHGCGW